MFAALAILAILQPSSPQYGKAVPDERLNRLFQSREGWIGADAAFSVPIGRKSSWWLFSDTWIGRIVDGKRVDPTMVNNTAARLDGGKLTFIIRHSKDGKATALVTPRETQTWFWFGPGTMVEGKLYVFLSQMEKAGGGGAFGFKQVGLWLGVMKNPDLSPDSWKLTQLQIPFAHYDGRREVSLGFSLCKAGSWLYVYGTDEDILPNWRARYLSVARCPAKQIAEFSKWEFWTGSCWSADPKAAARTVDHMASDGSVSYLPKLGSYVLVYIEDGISSRIFARTSRSPEGPWSKPTEVYRCPEGADKGVFCYSARNHPELAIGNELVISYCTNAFDFWQVLKDAKLYFPRFIRVPIKPEN